MVPSVLKLAEKHADGAKIGSTSATATLARQLETRIGKMELKIPKLRHGSYVPAFLDPRKASERALGAVVQA